VLTYYGPRRICGYHHHWRRHHWHRRHWHHHHRHYW
jgi:hypothetical protein